jgi:hypothetical protein
MHIHGFPRPFPALAIRLFTACSLFASVSRAQSFPPAWWLEQGAVDPAAEQEDFAAANIGQLKRMAVSAAAAMDIAYEATGGAGTPIVDLVDAWHAEPIAGGQARDDYAALNQGQLKAVASLFYDRLAEVGYLGGPTLAAAYPWTVGTTDDDAYALVNLGQLKYVFSFSITNPTIDADGDGLPDEWELHWFPSLTVANAISNYDEDAFTDMDEYLAGTSPIAVGGGTVYPPGGGPNSAPPPPTILTYRL